RLLRVWFRRSMRCCASSCHTPMVNHPWQMLDLLGLNMFHATERQIVVLRAFKADSKTANSTDQVGSVNAEMRDKVLREEKLGVPIGFKIWIGTATACIELIFITVEQLQSSIFVDGQGDEIKRGPGQLIVVIQQRHKIALCHVQRIVRCR